MITRRRFGAIALGGGFAAGFPLLRSGGTTGARQPERDQFLDTSQPGVTTVLTPIEISDGVMLDHFRLVDQSHIDKAAIVGALSSTSTDPVVVPHQIEIVARDHDDVIVVQSAAYPDYPVLYPGDRIGFTMDMFGIPAASLDPFGFSFAGRDIRDWALQEIEDAPIEIERADELSRDYELSVELVVRNTSERDYVGMVGAISVWDRNGYHCGRVQLDSGNISPWPAGDAIRIGTIPCCFGLNPVDIAEPDFTWEPWIMPAVGAGSES